MQSSVLVSSFAEIAREKGIDRDTLQMIMEDVFRAMIRKRYGADDAFEIIFNPDHGDIQILHIQEVVPDYDLEDPVTQIEVTKAQQVDEDFDVEDEVASEISIADDGVVFARYSNGADTALGQVALSTFVNPQGLQSQGNNAWAETHASGTPRTGAPDTSDFGQIQAGALESSTVDLTEQLVNMITAQRNFQANAQMISTQDQTTQTVINIR